MNSSGGIANFGLFAGAAADIGGVGMSPGVICAFEQRSFRLRLINHGHHVSS